jgi:hypothetical protein
MNDLAARVDRIESHLAIQQLPIRYALAIDGRDLDAWVDLFVADVNCGRHGVGREALKSFIAPTLSGFYRSQHQICGHRIEFIDSDHAKGAVYCRAEHEDGDKWVVMAICYFDDYERRDRGWYFVRRQEKHWYAADVLERPSGPDWTSWQGHEAAVARLPSDFPAWAEYWREAGEESVRKRTRFPVG